MKTIVFYIVLVFSCLSLEAQQSQKPGEELRNLTGDLVSFSDIVTPGHPAVLVFWKSGSSKCCENLETMQSAWLSTLKNEGVNFIAICEDCSGSWSHVKPIVAAKDWDFDVYIDPNGDFRRSMGVTTIPTTILFDSDMKLICRHPGWCSGNEDLLCTKILGHLEASKNIPH